MRAAPFTTRFVQALNDKFADEMGKPVFTIEAGRKYDKIMIQSTQWGSMSGGRSVHAFVERGTGALLKAASWKAPQRDKDGIAVRYNLATDEGFSEAIDAADQHGGYLYKR
jgi:hypothetical protein